MRINCTILRNFIAASFTTCALLCGSWARADVKLPAIMADHMVLQQGMAVPVWGTADAGEQVTVTFGQQKQAAKADDMGHWEVKLQPLTANDKGEDLTVAGKNSITLKDILVGEVWIASGQSNMEFGIKNGRDAQQEITAGDHPHIRLFTVPKHVADEPQTELLPQSQPNKKDEGKWLVCSPQNLETGDWGGFSAAGYFFGRDLHEDLKVPVGIIHTSWGGTVAEAWARHSYLENDPDFAPMLDRDKDPVANYQRQLERWNKAAAQAKAQGKKAPRKPGNPEQNPNRPSVLYNGMIAPIVPFAARGVIWYQGESNADRAYQYRKLLPAMIKSWRDAWGEPNMEFLIVSLANFQNPPKNPGDSAWAELREAQTLTAALPHNGQALAIDLADVKIPGDIHPKDKQDVGKRLELVALAKAYGKHVEYSGPEFENMKVDGNKAVLHFKFANGLHLKGGDTLKGFQIAGEGKTWHWADAKIDGDTVSVSSKDVEKPAAVRYDWANNPEGNLYNKANLPTVPFRTDDWPTVTQGRK